MFHATGNGGAAVTPVVDLRQYTVVPGQRDTLIDLFDGHFVMGQEEAGIHVVGQYRDLDDPDRFVWLRAFESMAVRGEALARFYYGPVWQQHRDRANATMIDSDNALLLEPLYLGPGYPKPRSRVAAGPAASTVAITVAYLAGPITVADHTLAGQGRTALATAGAEVVAVLASHAAENNFPALPLREESVLVWVTRFVGDASYARHAERLASSAAWADLCAQLSSRCSQLPMQRLRLRPTPRSLVR